MDVIYQVSRDHDVALIRVAPDSTGCASYEHLLVLVPVEFRGGTVKFCLLARSDVTILRDNARNSSPRPSAPRPVGSFTNLVVKLSAGDSIHVGPGLTDFKLLSIDRGRATIQATMRVNGLLLDTEPPSPGSHEESDLHDMIDRLNRGDVYRRPMANDY